MSKSPTSPKTQAFVIPTEHEVITFIDKVMKDWPRKFCEYYGSKFYNHYAARGWRLSKNILMKDWHACFFSQWREPQFPADQKMLEQCYKEPAHQAEMEKRRQANAGIFRQQEVTPTADPMVRALDYADYIMTSYLNNEGNDGLLRRAWDWLTVNKILVLTTDQENEISYKCGNDGNLRAILQVKFFFRYLHSQGLTVKSYFHSKFQSAQI